MRNTVTKLFFCGAVLLVKDGAAQDRAPVASLCELQMQLPQGDHRTVTVEGVYMSGPEHQFLVAERCREARTKVDFELKNRRLWTKLVRMTNKTDQERHVVGSVDPVLVVFEGEFYGPPKPDLKLPEDIRRVYRPGWDSGAMTKIVVHEIISVKNAPPEATKQAR